MLAGDTHGNIDWLRKYLFPIAMVMHCEAMVVLGDFGAWEHTAEGRLFMTDVGKAATASRVPLYWLHGNHDKFSLTLKTYGSERTGDGFVRCRENLFYIPQGHVWTWDAKTFRSFGGAYSIDKTWRLEQEQARYQLSLREARRAAAGNLFVSDLVAPTAGTLWFPEEEMTDGEMEQLLLDDFSPKDVVLSHDKPLSAKPGWNRKDYPACVPNQLRLDQALRKHRPAYWVHGHLHYHYIDQVFGPRQSWQTTVIGLEPDNHAAQHDGWSRENAWVVLELSGVTVQMQLGRDITLSQPAVTQARKRLMTLL